jgi:hypothetical protein
MLQGRLVASGHSGENADVYVWDYNNRERLYRCLRTVWHPGMYASIGALTALSFCCPLVRTHGSFEEHDFGIGSLSFSADEVCRLVVQETATTQCGVLVYVVLRGS